MLLSASVTAAYSVTVEKRQERDMPMRFDKYRAVKAITGYLAVALLMICVARPAAAWNDAGHYVIARIAWLRLNDSQREAVQRVLRQHPHYDKYLAADRPMGVSEAEWVFVRAATWADFVRPPKGFKGEAASHPIHKFHRGPWHYINYPYFAGQKSSSLPTQPLANETNILQELERSINVLAGKRADDSDAVAGLSAEANKAVRLTWLFHLLGDLHQPLHVTALVDDKLFPAGDHGDQGGNKLAIRRDAMSKPINLHSFWDGMLGSDSRFAHVSQLADELTHDPQLMADTLPEFGQHRTILSWAAEGYSAAKSNVYLDGRLPRVLMSDFDAGTLKADRVPVLSERDLAKAHTLAKRRVTLAGYRLAEKLRGLDE